MKLYFFGMDTASPDVCKEAIGALYAHLANMKPALYPCLPTFYFPIRDMDGDNVFLTDKECPDQEISWEVRSTPRQSPGSDKLLVWKDTERNIYIYQHFENRQRNR